MNTEQNAIAQEIRRRVADLNDLVKTGHEDGLEVEYVVDTSAAVPVIRAYCTARAPGPLPATFGG